MTEFIHEALIGVCDVCRRALGLASPSLLQRDPEACLSLPCAEGP